MRRALVLLLLAVAGCSGGSSGSALPDVTVEGVKTYPGLSHDHLTKASQYPVSYPQTPPAGGPHSLAWLRCDVYAEPVPAENAVHSMEHGGIWITYRPDLPEAAVRQLAELAQANVNYVLVSPYPDLPAPVVASSWGLQLTATGADDPRLLAFVRAYAGGDQGGEKGADCRQQGLTPEAARQFDAKAEQP